MFGIVKALSAVTAVTKSERLHEFRKKVVIISRMTQGTTEATTTFRIRHYFDMSPQIWSSQDVNAFKCAFDLQNYLRDNGISCLFAIDVLLTFRLLKECPVPYAIVFRGYEFTELSKSPEDLEAVTLCVHNSRHVIANTEAAQQRIQELWPNLEKGKLVYVPNGVSCSPAPRSSVMCLSKYNLKSDAVIFTMVTKIEHDRDPLYIVPHFTDWHQLTQKRHYLVIVGHMEHEEDDFCTRFKRIVDSCPGVIYAGPLTLRETHRIISDSFALVTSAIKPRSCTPVLEAMKLGVPVIARNSASTAALIKHQSTGLLYSLPDDFVTQAESIVEDKAFRQEIIANAKAYVEENFNENVEYEAYSNMAKEMCTPFSELKENVSENADEQSNEVAAERRVHFGKFKANVPVTEVANKSTVESRTSTEKPDATEDASSNEKKNEEQNQVVENKTATRHQKLGAEKKTPAEISPRTSQPKLANSTPAEKAEKQPPASKTAEDDHRPTQKDEGVKRASTEKLAISSSSTSSPLGTRVAAAAAKTDVRKRANTDAASSEKYHTQAAAASVKGGGITATTTKNGHPLAAPTVTDNAKKTTTTATALKKTSSDSCTDENSTTVKPPSAQRLAARTVSDTSSGSARSRSLKTARRKTKHPETNITDSSLYRE